MSDEIVEPYFVLASGDGADVPVFLLKFDRDGTCTSPDARAGVLGRLAQDGITDLYLFSHGWNNDFAAATEHYKDFARGYIESRRALGLAIGRPYRPLLVGITWPSTSLLLPWEHGPAIAGPAPTNSDDDAVVDAITADLPTKTAARVRELAGRRRVDSSAAHDLAAAIAPFFATPADEESGETSTTELTSLWEKTLSEEDIDLNAPIGIAGGTTEGPAPAGLLTALDPRQILRLATVRMMKDRAGRVGAAGIGPLLVDVLAASVARVHLIGHSYGGRVMLSAVCARDMPRRVDSMLLLQAAVNRMCFAAKATASGGPGGYRRALERVVQPILATFSPKDVPLRRFFHLALRRGEDLGEAEIAGGLPPPFGALGGYGPGGIDDVCAIVKMKYAPDRYVFDPAARVIALDGSVAITGHGDISNAATWWALYNQVTTG